jgi:hypothetical protein
MTECLVKSIDKHTSDCHIFIFDNSDKEPFIYKQNNLTVFDNTQGQIIDFEKILEQYPEHVLTTSAIYKWGSFKHCISVDKCMELINEPFVLLDSDVLIKKDITPLFQEDKIFVGEIEKISKYFEPRVCPYMCFINVKLCKKYNIHYYHDSIIGLKKPNKYTKTKDTGSYFYLISKAYEYQEINIYEYIIHLEKGSHTKTEEEINKWLKLNQEFYN